MAFLSVCGIAVPVAIDSFRETYREVGETVVAYSGQMSKSRLARKTDVSFDTTILTQAEAHALATLVSGAGETWSFDSSLYSYKGNGPAVSTGCSITATYYKYGGNSLTITSGNNFEANKRTCSLASGLTVLTWFRDSAGGTWTHYVVTKSAGGSTYNYWTNGSGKTQSSPPCYTTAPAHTNLYLTPTGATRWWDDLVSMPCIIPDAWAAQLYTFCASYAFSSFPRLTLMGDCIQETSRTVLGAVTGSVAIPSRIGGSYTTTGRVLSITLSEI